MRTNRRDFIRLAVAGTAATSTLGLSTTLTGCSDQGPAAGMKRIRPADVELVRALSPAVLDGDVAVGDAASLDAIVVAFDQMLEDLSEPVVAGVQQAFGLLSFGLTRGLMTGQWSGWSSASLEDAQGALGRLRQSDIATLNAIYAAVVRLIASAWYALPQGVAITGYPGPPTKVLDYVPGTTERTAATEVTASDAGTDSGADAGSDASTAARSDAGTEVSP